MVYQNLVQKLKYILDRRTLENVSCEFVRSKLEYASITWDCCTEADNMKLENIQHDVAKIVTRAKRDTSRGLLQ